MIGSFKLSELEEKEINNFKVEHVVCSMKLKKTRKKKPLQWSLILTPDGIGVGVEIRCNVCNKIKDITDVGKY